MKCGDCITNWKLKQMNTKQLVVLDLMVMSRMNKNEELKNHVFFHECDALIVQKT